MKKPQTQLIYLMKECTNEENEKGSLQFWVIVSYHGFINVSKTKNNKTLCKIADFPPLFPIAFKGTVMQTI